MDQRKDTQKRTMNWLKSEAVYLQAVVQSAIACAVAFGWHLSSAQVAAITCLSAAVLSMVVKGTINSGGGSTS